MPLDARVALITGAAGRIGSAIARELSADGAYVCLVGGLRVGPAQLFVAEL